MQDPIVFCVGELSGEVEYEDWFDPENPGVVKTRNEILCRVVYSNVGDNICIGGTGKDGKYYQFDSQESWYAESFFSENFEKHGLTYKSYMVKADLTKLERI